ncbi:hypothetical protein B0A52_09417 [Exophiala mesophila]|uniref:C2H2-type domain-containing protein n=1 Tax=Exophiala mesophila TaxID=212818 RepID=A0A438MSE0_EXOME|nr:hypothetical protein B0A52_09417 [Exophiala mesophila]
MGPAIRSWEKKKQDPSHTKEKPFQCEICGKNYGRHDTLLRHQKDHTGDQSKAGLGPNATFHSSQASSLHEGLQRASETASNDPSNSPLTQDRGSIYDAIRHDSINPSGHTDPVGMILPENGASKPAPTYDSVASNFQTPFDAPFDIFNFDFEAEYPAWLADGDFHAGLLDTPLINTMAELKPNWTESPYVAHSPSGTYKSAPNMKHLWYTPGLNPQDEIPPSGPATPPETQVEVDDSYRQTLHQSLQIRAPHESTLPSADFLNLCVRSYFSKFHPCFPVIHAPTFRPSKSNSMVLLSICSVGSLFTGSVNAIRQGVQIFERLHKAVLANWDRLINRGRDEKISLIQTAIIGQTFGLLSGEPKHLAIVDTFNGTLISWARRLGSFKARRMRDLDLSLTGDDLETQWRLWAKNEELIRIALSVHVHDAELANIFHHEPFLRHNSRQLPAAASQATFMAAKAEEWRMAYLNDPSNFILPGTPLVSVDANLPFDMLSIPSNSSFTPYTVLQGICVNIVENQISAHPPPARKQEISGLLTTFHSRFLQTAPPWGSDSMDMTILWHLAYMSICADFDLLERAIGREGGTLSTEDQVLVTAWANSVDAQRCVIHGTIIQKKLENLPLGFEPAIHVPRAIFRAGIAWFCYTRFGTEVGGQRAIVPESLDFPEFKIVGVNPAALLFQANGYKHGRPSATEINAALCGLTDLLRRIGHWEIARRFAAILAALLHDEAG